MEARQMYQERILDHYRNPRNKGGMDDPDIRREGENPACGDSLQIMMKVSDGMVEEVKFTGEGCAISQAATSMLTEELEGMDMEDIRELTKEDAIDLLGIPVSSTREKCAVLGLVTVKHGVEEYEGRDVGKTTTE